MTEQPTHQQPTPIIHEVYRRAASIRVRFTYDDVDMLVRVPVDAGSDAPSGWYPADLAYARDSTGVAQDRLVAATVAAFRAGRVNTEALDEQQQSLMREVLAHFARYAH